MSERIGCCVPFCRRTRQNVDPAYNEWICGDHWRLTDKIKRKVWGRINRRWRRFGPSSADPSPAYDRVWNAMKRQAIERAAGI